MLVQSIIQISLKSCSIPLLVSLRLRIYFCRLQAKRELIYRFRVGAASQNANLSDWLEMFHKRLALAQPLVMGETPVFTPRGLIRGISPQTSSTTSN